MSIFLGFDSMISDWIYEYRFVGRVNAYKITEGSGEGGTVSTSEMASQ
jgi:hypothetical protein